MEPLSLGFIGFAKNFADFVIDHALFALAHLQTDQFAFEGDLTHIVAILGFDHHPLVGVQCCLGRIYKVLLAVGFESHFNPFGFGGMLRFGGQVREPVKRIKTIAATAGTMPLAPAPGGRT